MSFTGLSPLLVSERHDCRSCLQVRIYTAQQDTSEQDQLLSAIYRKYRYLIDSELDYFVVTHPMM